MTKTTKLIAFAIATGVATFMPAQTNTFPVSGNVGIGTTSPGSRKLNVQSPDSTNDVGVEVGLGRTTGTNYGLLVGSNGVGADLNQGILAYASGGYANFGVRIYNVSAGASNYALYSDSAAQSYFMGNVGIGTASANYRLDVSGTIRSSTELLTTNGTWATWDFTRISSDGVTSHYNAGGAENGIAFEMDGTERMRITNGGNVGIGTANPGAYKLAVVGKVRAQEVVVDTGWSDYVFASDYQLPALSTVEAHIKAEKHLPGVPSAQEVAAHGIGVGEMQAKLLAKIEELTLHQIEQEKRLNEQAERVTRLEVENAALRAR